MQHTLFQLDLSAGKVADLSPMLARVAEHSGGNTAKLVDEVCVQITAPAATNSPKTVATILINLANRSLLPITYGFRQVIKLFRNNLRNTH